LTAKEFGKVDVRRSGAEVQVRFTILMEPEGREAEGWQTGVALDASASMKNWYGRELEGTVPPFLIQEYERKGWVTVRNEDGRRDDLDAVKRLTTQVARDIEAGKRHPIKCVLIGVGNEIDEAQMEQLDNLDTGTEVDIWDHKIAKEMRALVEIFAEVVSENQIVAPTGSIYDAQGNRVWKCTDGVPATVSFSMPASSEWFELE